MSDNIRIQFDTTLRLPSAKAVEDELDLTVVADILPGDPGSLHCPASGPIPEITEARVSAGADVRGTRYERGEDVLDLLGSEDIFNLEDRALEEMAAQERAIAEQTPSDDEIYCETTSGDGDDGDIDLFRGPARRKG